MAMQILDLKNPAIRKRQAHRKILEMEISRVKRGCAFYEQIMQSARTPVAERDKRIGDPEMGPAAESHCKNPGITGTRRQPMGKHDRTYAQSDAEKAASKRGKAARRKERRTKRNSLNHFTAELKDFHVNQGNQQEGRQGQSGSPAAGCTIRTSTFEAKEHKRNMREGISGKP